MKETVAWVFGLGMGLNALLFVPQAITIFKTHNSTGVSLLTFGGFNVLQVLGILHGALQHDWSLAFGMAVSLLTCGSVTLLALIYRPTLSVTPK